MCAHSDIQRLEKSFGEPFSIFVQWSTTLLASVIIAFISNWRLALFYTVVIPVIIASAVILSRVCETVLIADMIKQEQILSI